ncbi:MAG: 30S ribosomal protein S8e [archaeon]
MVITQHKSRRSPSGSRYKSYRKKRIFESGNIPAYTGLGKKVVKSRRIVGAHKKIFLLSVDTANVYDPKSKKYVQLKIETIVENPANRHFVRRNIITKGTVIKTEKGNARVTNRPGQEGIINAVLV